MKYINTSIFILFLFVATTAIAETPYVERTRLVLGYGNTIEIGMDTGNAIKLLMGSDYRCDYSSGDPNQIIHCRSPLAVENNDAEQYEIEITVEGGKVEDFVVNQVLSKD